VSATPLVILGAGGHGRELLDVVEALNRPTPSFEFEGFLDDGKGPWPLLERRGVRVIGTLDDLMTREAHYAIGIGSPGARRRIDELSAVAGRRAASLVHPLASCGSDLRLGDGLFLAAGARVTTNVVTGRHVHLNVNATLSHDCRVGDYVTLNPGAHVNGNVTLGDDVTVGSGAVIRQGITVGERAMIAAGAVVVHDVAPDATVMGVPARERPR
jgi:sugar O-acyltransferase (sialic acid O-acetyltransferase NeuD family)